MKVLIADDALCIQKRVKEIVDEIHSVGHIGVASDMAEAKEQLLTRKYDVLITDIRLPDGNGLELLLYISKCELAMRSIVITSYPFPQYRRRAMQFGADCFLSKVDEMESLGDIIKEFEIDY